VFAIDRANDDRVGSGFREHQGEVGVPENGDISAAEAGVQALLVKACPHQAEVAQSYDLGMSGKLRRDWVEKHLHAPPRANKGIAGARSDRSSLLVPGGRTQGGRRRMVLQAGHER
jgi:hypothetical protein